ncbi:GbsR/MarR family transcriptional regulator, partial [Chloroflexota bacterium]
MGNKQQAEEKRFVEEVGILFEQTGMPRMAGRILGWLSVSDSPHQTTDQLTKALMASKGSISTMTRFLIR